MAAPTADELSRNPAFQGLVSVGREVLAAHAVLIREMDAEELRAHQAEVEALHTQLRARMQDHSEMSEPELDKLTELVGTSPAVTRAIGERVNTHGAGLSHAFPELQALDIRTRSVMIFDAIRRDEPTMDLLKRVSVETAADSADNACTAKCLTNLILALFDAQIAALNRMISCAVLVFPPVVFLCASIMLVIMIYEMNQANDEYTRCVDDCEEQGPGEA